jgi:hypothetical protein
MGDATGYALKSLFKKHILKSDVRKKASTNSGEAKIECFCMSVSIARRKEMEKQKKANAGQDGR